MRLPRAILIPVLVVRSIAGATVAGLLWFCAWRAPRGFSFPSRPFFEQEVLLPAFALLATAPFVATLVRVGPPPWVFRSAFWGAMTPLGLAMAVLGSTGYSRYFLVAVLLGFATFLLSEWRVAHHRWRLALVSFTLGLPFGASFLAVTRAPPAGTHPRSLSTAPPVWAASPEAPARDFALAAPFARVEYHAGSGAFVVEAHDERIVISPAFELTSYSPSCLWSIADYGHEELPPFRAVKLDERTSILKSEGRLLTAFVRVRTADDGVFVESVTHLHEEVCVHLAHALSFTWDSSVPWYSGVPRRVATVSVADTAFRIGGSRDFGSLAGRREFLAFRNGSLELLRATEDEKGPFTTLRRLPHREPVLSSAHFAVEIGGFVAQAAREPSPTAGYGVSQGAIEAGGGAVWVELAATSVGRGWDTVRLAPGTYAIDLHVRPLE